MANTTSSSQLHAKRDFRSASAVLSDTQHVAVNRPSSAKDPSPPFVAPSRPPVRFPRLTGHSSVSLCAAGGLPQPACACLLRVPQAGAPTPHSVVAGASRELGRAQNEFDRLLGQGPQQSTVSKRHMCAPACLRPCRPCPCPAAAARTCARRPLRLGAALPPLAML